MTPGTTAIARLAAAAALASAVFAVTESAFAQPPVATGTPSASRDGAQRPVVDPTVPPPGFGKPGTGSADGTGAPPPPAARVQMIVRGPGETRMAVVNGETLHVGDLVRHEGGAARVLRITDAAVILDKNGSRHTLELVPGAGNAVGLARSR